MRTKQQHITEKEESSMEEDQLERLALAWGNQERLHERDDTIGY